MSLLEEVQAKSQPHPKPNPTHIAVSAPSAERQYTQINLARIKMMHITTKRAPKSQPRPKRNSRLMQLLRLSGIVTRSCRAN